MSDDDARERECARLRDQVAGLARELGATRAQRDELARRLESARSRARAFVPRVRPCEGGPE